MLAGFAFSRLTIVQSLEPEEVATGTLLSEYVEGLRPPGGNSVAVTVVNCESSRQFLDLLATLTHNAELGATPLLHVECHGHADEGLEFANGSTLSWADLADALLPLNRATRFNLLAVFSACFGAHFIQELGVIKPAPCWCVVAPTAEVDPAEVMAGFRMFYASLFKRADMGQAIDAISHCQLSNGKWMAEPAELWFQRVFTSYVRLQCNNEAARKRAKEIRRKAQLRGINPSAGSILRQMRRRNRSELLQTYFESYFMLEVLPENAVRFAEAKSRTLRALDALRKSGKYLV